jgi:hypothetical protein
MSLFNQRVLLESAALLGMAVAAAAEEPISAEPVSACSVTVQSLVDSQRAQMGEILKRNTVYVRISYAGFHKYSAGFVVHIPLHERGPQYDERMMYIVGCRHGVLNPCGDPITAATDADIQLYSHTDKTDDVQISCSVMVDETDIVDISRMSDVALLSCRRQDHLPEGLTLAQNPDFSVIPYALLTDRRRISRAMNDPEVRVASYTGHAIPGDSTIESGTRLGVMFGGEAIQGNSGAAIIEPLNGHVVGMTFADAYRQRTLAVMVSDIRDFLSRQGILAHPVSTPVIANATLAK